MKFDPRRSRRLRLKRPAAVMTSFGPAKLLDLGPASLALSHDWAAEKGATTWLEFSWSGRLMRLECEVRRIRYVKADAHYRSGLLITGGVSAEDYKKRVRNELDRSLKPVR